MTCKDCVHRKVCVHKADYKFDVSEYCPNFKNKADFVEVKHGEWFEVQQTGRNNRHIKYTTKKCSVCGYWNGRRKTNFCPYCGADMRKEGADNGDI